MPTTAASAHDNVERFPGAAATADDALVALNAFAEDLDRALDRPLEDDGDARVQRDSEIGCGSASKKTPIGFKA